MSRSEHAQPLTLATRAAIGCMLVLVAGCRFSTNPGDMIVEPDAGPAQQPRAAQEDDTGAAPNKASTGTAPIVDAGSEPADSPDAALSDDADSDDRRDSGQTPQAAGSPAPATSPTAGSSAPATAGSSAPATAGSPAPASPPSAAGSPALADAGTVDTPALDASTPPAPSANEVQCSADLADCLVRNPLGYAECLRANQESGCPEPDSGVATTSPVTTEDGKPLSQACQAELANCIMRLPTPENAASCTEKARKCK